MEQLQSLYLTRLIRKEGGFGQRQEDNYFGVCAKNRMQLSLLTWFYKKVFTDSHSNWSQGWAVRMLRGGEKATGGKSARVLISHQAKEVLFGGHSQPWWQVASHLIQQKLKLAWLGWWRLASIRQSWVPMMHCLLFLPHYFPASNTQFSLYMMLPQRVLSQWLTKQNVI